MKLFQGAEAIITKNNNEIIKESFSKAYRLPHLDESLRKFRTRREAKVLTKLDELNFPAPKIHEFSDKRMTILMDFVPGRQLKEVLKEGDDYQHLALEMGNRVGDLHTANIIHGDLTTSNMIQHKETSKIHLLDFGLSQFSDKIEDKAVDLFLMERSLESTHFEIPDLFTKVIEGYKDSCPSASVVLERLEAVRKRGRNKTQD